MESNGNVPKTQDAQEIINKSTGKSMRLKLLDHVSLCIPGKEEQNSDQTQHGRRFLDFLKARPSKDWLLKFGCVGRSSPFSYVKRLGSLRSSSTQPPSADCAPIHGRQPFRVPFVRKINWSALLAYCKNWAKHPMNMALLVWLFFVTVCLFVLFLFMTGLLDNVITESSQRKRWTEITNQIVNALFTIMCIYQHPRLLHHLFLLYRWRAEDVEELRKVYCKSNGAHRPNEWAHMMFVVALLHITCLAQYGLCGLCWGYSSEARPTWPQILLIAVGTIAPIIAGAYVIYSPLGRKYKPEGEEESQGQIVEQVTEANEMVEIAEPKWVGGLFDCSDDLTVASLSFFCTFCVFGWNMERLGFGNMYVHIVTFMLLCVSPLLVFSVAAINIDDDAVRYMMGVAGVVLCFCGLLYGGFWRMQMRKKFKLTASPFCCGYPAMTDFMQWLFCWSCSLAQEVRTGNFYDIEENILHSKEREEEESSKLQPLPREGELGPMIESNTSAKEKCSTPPQAKGVAKHDGSGCVRMNVEEEKDELMRPPRQPLIQA
ncbi:hypothetical protein Cni_G26794 [Canna indica]|uniref:PLAC8 family protein n=1 Tax=Canna indica TaxID=4628 RepID=A0AAQ3QQU1_9LILI|nr:hypothetical protein Cni_G26794 [Canna indica]